MVHEIRCIVSMPKTKLANQLFRNKLRTTQFQVKHRAILLYHFISSFFLQLCCVEDFQTVQVIKLLKYEKKVAKMCFLMISTFLICWMPYAVVSLLVTYGYSNLVTPTVAIIPSFFAKSSTAYNPVIYIFMSRKVGTLKIFLFE